MWHNGIRDYGAFQQVVSSDHENRWETTGFASGEPKTVGRQQVSLNGEFRNSEGFRLQIENLFVVETTIDVYSVYIHSANVNTVNIGALGHPNNKFVLMNQTCPEQAI